MTADVRQDEAVKPWDSFAAPLVALAALGVVVLICRWVFATPARRTHRPASPPGPADFGLLVPVASLATPAEAEAVRRRLAEAGIRSTLAGERVLVFPADAGRARSLTG